MNYYIADTHFGCTNKYEGRTLEHDKLIKENWNRVITNSDTVYLLGDIGRIGNNKDNEYLCEIISTLKGKEKILVVGNHEQMKDARLRQLFTEITPYKEIVDNYNGLNHKLVLFHFPILFWASPVSYTHLDCNRCDHCGDDYICITQCFEENNWSGYERIELLEVD